LSSKGEMDDNVYSIALAGCLAFVVWRFVETKYVRKQAVAAKPIVIDAISVFVSVVAGGYALAAINSKTAHVVGVFTTDPAF
jgi:hypothetical protein